MEIQALKNVVTEIQNVMDEIHNGLQTPEHIINKNGSQVRTLYKEVQ